MKLQPGFTRGQNNFLVVPINSIRTHGLRGYDGLLPQIWLSCEQLFYETQKLTRRVSMVASLALNRYGYTFTRNIVFFAVYVWETVEFYDFYDDSNLWAIRAFVGRSVETRVQPARKSSESICYARRAEKFEYKLGWKRRECNVFGTASPSSATPRRNPCTRVSLFVVGTTGPDLRVALPRVPLPFLFLSAVVKIHVLCSGRGRPL